MLRNGSVVPLPPQRQQRVGVRAVLTRAAAASTSPVEPEGTSALISLPSAICSHHADIPCHNLTEGTEALMKEEEGIFVQDDLDTLLQVGSRAAILHLLTRKPHSAADTPPLRT